MNHSSKFVCVFLMALGLLGIRTTAFAECDDVEKQVPFHRVPMEDRTLGQRIQTRKFQIECMQSFIKKVRSSQAPKNAWRSPCDSMKCKKIFDRCNGAAANKEKYPICDGNDCSVANAGSDDYCFDAYKQSFGYEPTFCYQSVLGELDKATIGKCWKVQREKSAEQAETRLDAYSAEVQQLEFRITQGADRDAKEVKKDDDHSAGKSDNVRFEGSGSAIPEAGHERAE